jgi:hypothetical protein
MVSQERNLVAEENERGMGKIEEGEREKSEGQRSIERHEGTNINKVQTFLS